MGTVWVKIKTSGQVSVHVSIWLWVKTRYPKWNPGKWKHGPKLAVFWWLNFDPYPFSTGASHLGATRSLTPQPGFLLGATCPRSDPIRSLATLRVGGGCCQGLEPRLREGGMRNPASPTKVQRLSSFRLEPPKMAVFFRCFFFWGGGSFKTHQAGETNQKKSNGTLSGKETKKQTILQGYPNNDKPALGQNLGQTTETPAPQAQQTPQTGCMALMFRESLGMLCATSRECH